MKYYKNLFKNKAYFAIFLSIFIFLVGVFVFILSLKEVFANAFGWSGLSASTVVHTGIIGVLGSTNIGMTIVAILVMYTGLIFIPLNAEGSQNDEDYEVKRDGEYIYIRFRKNEFYVKAETFDPTNLFFRDKNKKFVSLTRGYQIYNHVIRTSKKQLEKEIDESKVILKFEVANKFSNVRTLSVEEKREFFEKQKLKDRIKIPFIILSIFLWGSFIFWSLGLLGFIITDDFTISNMVVALILDVLSFVFAKKATAAIFKNKKIIKKILNGDMYLAECKIYDRNTISSDDGKDYYVKLTDGNYIVDEWISIPEHLYKQNDVRVYIFDKTGSDYFTIC